MKFRESERTFIAAGVEIRHMADVELADDEQVTFVAASGSEYDVVRKSWGYYATPSLNGRLPAHGLRPVLAANPAGKAFLLLVEEGCEEDLAGYLSEQSMRILAWLDADDGIATLEARLGG